ncbi:Immunoglobulin, partial [Dysosmobacter welbionis]
AHDLLGAGLGDGHAGGQALVCHFKAHDLALMLQVGGQLGFVDTVMLRGLDLPDGIAGEGELFGHGQPPAVRANGINQIARLVVNLEHGPLQEC